MGVHGCRDDGLSGDIVESGKALEGILYLLLDDEDDPLGFWRWRNATDL